MEKAVPKEQIQTRFVQLIEGRNFITFTELEEQLGLSQTEVISLKTKFEEALCADAGQRMHITSRVDLTPPGFEIGD
jgi:hypothetical protein